MGVGQGQIQHIGVEIVPTSRAMMLRVGHLQLSRPPGHRVAQIVQRPPGRPQPIRSVSAPRTGAASIVAGSSDNLRRRKILDTPDAFGGIGYIVSGAIHDHISQQVFSARYRPIIPRP